MKIGLDRVDNPYYHIGMVELCAYNLNDAELIESARQKSSRGDYDPNGEIRLIVFQPTFKAVVLGQSNSIQYSVNTELCLSDCVMVMKRPSGGESVYISPEMLILSFSLLGKRLARSKDVFAIALSGIITALEAVGVHGVKHSGISDLSIADKKIMGCAIYRKPGMALFHAVINVNEAPQTIGKYLLHPSREPDYRMHRKHEDFITNLVSEGFDGDYGRLKQELQSTLLGSLETLLR